MAAKIDNVRVFGLDESIIASGYPMATDLFNYKEVKQNEKDRATKLAQTKPSSGHDQFLTSIIVQFDLTFPLKAWVELQRYHFVDFCSSMSTMHKILNMNIDECCNEFVSELAKDNLKEKIAEYKNNETPENFLKVVYNIPAGFEYTARLTTNYRQLKTIYTQRRNHRLPDWQIFCNWIETLPEAKNLIIRREINGN